jgi:hypothetical protein
MVKVRALTRGFIGGVIREMGETFEWPEGHKMGSWVKPVGGASGGDAAALASSGKAQAEIPGDWKSAPAADRKALAAELSGKEVSDAKEADKIIEAFNLVGSFQSAFQAAPFTETPEPATVTGNGIQAALGGVAPDWIAPAAQTPQPVAD